MGGKEKMGTTPEEKKDFPKVDVEIKNAKVAYEVQKQFADFLTKTPEYQEVNKLKNESGRMNRELQKTFNEKFEAQVDSGEIVQVLAKLEKQLQTQSPEEVARNNGAGLTLPVQLVLSHVTAVIGADGQAGAQSIAALNKFQLANKLPVTSTFMIDAATMHALIYAYTKDYREDSKFKNPTPEQLAARENNKYKGVLINYFVNGYYTKPRIEDILPHSMEDRTQSISSNIPKDQIKTWHDMIRADGVSSVAFGPSPFGQNSEPWLDVSKLDVAKNPNITLKVHTNNNYETAFNVNVKDITYINSRGELKVNTPELYEKTRQALIAGYAKKRFNGANATGIV